MADGIAGGGGVGRPEFFSDEHVREMRAKIARLQFATDNPQAEWSATAELRFLKQSHGWPSKLQAKWVKGRDVEWRDVPTADRV